MIRLPAEWEPQDGVLLCWPHKKTDWAEILDRVEPVFFNIAREISRFEQVVIVSPETVALQEKLVAAGIDTNKIHLVELETNDTWVRDFGPITIYVKGVATPLNFNFNGWGNKFAAELDNRITTRLGQQKFFSSPPQTVDFVLEGGSIDSDGKGNLLTTTRCLLNPNRNPQMTQAEIEHLLSARLGCSNILWLTAGMLLGDDTDSHIDILARFAPEETILFVACEDENDPHFTELEAMRHQLEGFRTAAGRPFRLDPLPLPSARYDAEGNRLAATYANFLVINNAVLVPAYDDPLDQKAVKVIANAFPGREIVRINCLPLIEEGGSLHCSTMQLPQGVLS